MQNFDALNYEVAQPMDSALINFYSPKVGDVYELVGDFEREGKLYAKFKVKQGNEYYTVNRCISKKVFALGKLFKVDKIFKQQINIDGIIHIHIVPQLIEM